MRVANLVKASLSEWRRGLVAGLVGLLLVSCTGGGNMLEEDIQFNVAVIEEAPVQATSLPEPTVVPTTTPLPTISQDDLSVPVEPDYVAQEAPAQAEIEQGEEGVSLELPDEYYIRNIYGHKQYYPLWGVRPRWRLTLRSYFGVEIIESEFQNRLPLSDNPDYGFVGSVEGPVGAGAAVCLRCACSTDRRLACGNMG
jgi:hypothetical protein